jgi:hypothetical protein
VILTSDWGDKNGLSEQLIGRFFACDRKGTVLPGTDEVRAAVIESSLDASFNWTSPFENSGAHSKMPALSNLLTSGTMSAMYESLARSFGKPIASENAADSEQARKSYLAQFEGKSDMTKLNSTQVFAGSGPTNISATLLWKAFKDPVAEVEKPVMKLLSWAYPQLLAADGAIVNVINSLKDNGVLSPGKAFEALFPSSAPQVIGFTLGGRTFAPMVIENFSFPLTSPKDSRGRYVELQMQIKLGTLTSQDKGDIQSTFGGFGQPLVTLR